MVEHPLFENVILLCIFISSMLLAFEEPGMDGESTKAKNLLILDYVFTAIFTVEMIAKVRCFDARATYSHKCSGDCLLLFLRHKRLLEKWLQCSGLFYCVGFIAICVPGLIDLLN